MLEVESRVLVKVLISFWIKGREVNKDESFRKEGSSDYLNLVE